MTERKRIAVNIVATYGRSLYALVIGLFCGRWALMALGEVDYGLIGVVGGLTAFISFFNGIMAGGVGRFYAISVGESKNDPVRGLEKCREWFTTAVMIHTILPVALMVIGYPAGEWAVRNFLTIPPDRVESCVWVWRFTCISCFVGMASVPYNAMYNAKQEIAELTVYSFVTTTLNFCFLYYAIRNPGDWLARYAGWGCFLSVAPSLTIALRSVFKYKECRFRRAYARCWGNIKNMMSYSGWLFIGSLGDLFSAQGMNVLVNKYFGPRVNAAQNVSNTLSGQCTTLSGSILGAFWPAIMNAYGARDFVHMRKMAYLVCKLAPMFIMLFAIPLALEIDEVLLLWLKKPPEFAAGLCVLALIVLVGDRTTHGFAIAMHSTGEIAKYQIVVGGVYLFALPLAWVFFANGFSVYALGYAMLISRGACAFMRIIMARKKTGLSLRYWIVNVLVPILAVATFTIAMGLLPRMFMCASFGRVCITSAVCVSTMAVSSWFFAMNFQERSFVCGKMKLLLRRIVCA